MVDEIDDPDTAAARLEAALERIAQSAAEPRGDAPAGAVATTEIAARLDSLITRLRGALAARPG